MVGSQRFCKPHFKTSDVLGQHASQQVVLWTVGIRPLNWVWNAQAVSRFGGEAKSRATICLRKSLGRLQSGERNSWVVGNHGTVCAFRNHRRLINDEPDCSWNGCPWRLAISVGIAFGGQAQEGSRNSNLPIGLRYRGRPFRHYNTHGHKLRFPPSEKA